MAKSKDQPGKDAALDPALPQKKRARRRLVGAAALCLAAAIAVPLVLDSEPHRPAEDIKVQIPSRDTPLPNPAASDPAAKVEPKADAKPDAKAQAEPKADAKAPAKTDAKANAAANATANAAPNAKADAKTDTKADAQAAPAGKRGEAKKYLLQIGAFANEKGAGDQLEKVRAAGLKGFTEKVRTAQGERIRVRVGPFANREAAEQARGQLKLAGIDSALIAP